MQIYFTVDCQKTAHSGGFADRTHVYQALRRLGLSLGYTYLHTPMHSPTRTFPVETLRWKKSSLSWLLSIWSRIRQEYYRAVSPNIYGFMGWNSYFAQDKSLPNCRDFPKNRRCNLALSGPFLKGNDISSLDNLKSYIKLLVAQKKEANLPLLLVFIIPANRAYLRRIVLPIPFSVDTLDWRAIYLQQRKKHPIKSRFRKRHLKIIAHLRLGDRAAFSTPWGTWIMKFHAPRKKTSNWQQVLEESYFPQITSIDFYRFMHGLLGQLPRELCDTQIFSDGFKRTISNLENQRQRFQATSTLSLSPSEWQLLKKDLRHQQCLLKPLLDNIPNSTCHIGEKQRHLLSLIAASIEADIAITATPFQHHLLCLLLSTYRTTTQSPPLLILLRKKIDQRHMQEKKGMYPDLNLNWLIPEMDAVHVDINAPDFPALAQRIMNHWNSNKPR